MKGPSLEALYIHVRSLANGHAQDAPTDRACLERYLSLHDEDAFAALVQRHGAMVLATCRRLLPCEQDAEDAWQATFLVLARRAASIRRQHNLAGWLHGVACRVAKKLLADHARRRTRNGDVPDVAGREAGPDPSWREVQAILDEELERLPERYRLPIVLCYLEGHTRDEAAQRLGLTLSTLRGRLERARAQMRGRLIRRGVTLSATLLGIGLTAPSQAAVPALLTVGVVRSAKQLVDGASLGSVVSGRIAIIIEGVIQTMCWTRATLAAVVLLSVSLVTLSAGLLAQAPFKTPAAATPAQPPAVQLPVRQAAAPDLTKRVEELEKQVARLNREVEALKQSAGKLAVPPARKNDVEIITLKLAQAKAVAMNLTNVLYRDRPDVKIEVNERTNTLLVRADAFDLAKIRTIVAKWDGGPPKEAEPAPVFKNFTLKTITAENAAKVIQALLDDKQTKVIAVGENTLIVHGLPNKIILIQEILMKIDVVEAKPKPARLIP